MSAQSKTAPGRGAARALGAEGNARAAIEARVGHPVTDAEWAEARGRLLEFVTILRAWDRENQGAKKLGNV